MLRPICNERKIPLKTVRQTLEQKLYHTLKRKMHVVKEHVAKKQSTSYFRKNYEACQVLGYSNCEAEKLGYQPITQESSQLSNDPPTMGPSVWQRPNSTKVALKDLNPDSLTIFSLEPPLRAMLTILFAH